MSTADKNLIRVTIVIDDVNDEPPIFEEAKYVTAVDTEVEQGYQVATVSSFDLVGRPRPEYSCLSFKQSIASYIHDRLQV